LDNNLDLELDNDLDLELDNDLDLGLGNDLEELGLVRTEQHLWQGDNVLVEI